tara:strand:- start:454 stop:873 length:420 start_codon:yes stop_codon:yes gene_type:complete
MRKGELTTVEKGRIGELAIYKHLVELGYNIYAPIADVDHVDLVVELDNGVFSRVQIKTIVRTRFKTSIEVKLKKYSAGRIDVVAVYYQPKDIIAFIPFNGEDHFILAIATAKNNQEENRKWIWQYEQFPEFQANKKYGK